MAAMPDVLRGFSTPTSPFSGGALTPDWLQYSQKALGFANADPGGEQNFYGSNNPYFDPNNNTLIMPSGMVGGSGAPAGFSIMPNAGAYNDKNSRSQLNGLPMYNYGSDGQFLGQQTASGWHTPGDGGLMGALGVLALPFAAAGLGLGAGGAAAGAGEAAGAGVTGLSSGADLSAAFGGLDGGATLGGGAMAGDILGGSGVPGVLGKAVSGLSGLFGGGGNGSLSVGNLLGFAPGLASAITQGNASNKMLGFLNGQQAKIDNLYSPGSPEYNYLFDQLSRQDAAAGRNSQVGPRSVDLAARIAQIKADNTSRLTAGIANPMATAINQGANRFSGLAAALGQNGGVDNFLKSMGVGLNGMGANTDSMSTLAALSGSSLPSPEMQDSFFDNLDIGDWFL